MNTGAATSEKPSLPVVGKYGRNTLRTSLKGSRVDGALRRDAGVGCCFDGMFLVGFR